MGYLRPRGARIELEGDPSRGLPTHAIARRGVGYAPEEGGIFGDLTVAENIEIATWTRPERPPRRRADRPRLRGVPPPARYAGPRRHPPVGRRAQDARDRPRPRPRPRLLLLDEPFEGLSPAIVPQVAASIAAITRQGRAILMAESNVHHVPPEATRLYVIERGEIIYGGPPDGARRDPAVLRAIGGSATA